LETELWTFAKTKSKLKMNKTLAQKMTPVTKEHSERRKYEILTSIVEMEISIALCRRLMKGED
jgi:hypothetical protein